MRAGPLRHRVTLESGSETQDSAGGIVLSFTTVATVWASVEPVRGKEYFAAQQVASDVTHLVRLRRQPGISPTTKWRVIFNGRKFDIESVIEVLERRREWQLMCIERHQDGFRD